MARAVVQSWQRFDVARTGVSRPSLSHPITPNHTPIIPARPAFDIAGEKPGRERPILSVKSSAGEELKRTRRDGRLKQAEQSRTTAAAITATASAAAAVAVNEALHSFTVESRPVLTRPKPYRNHGTKLSDPVLHLKPPRATDRLGTLLCRGAFRAAGHADRDHPLSKRPPAALLSRSVGSSLPSRVTMGGRCTPSRPSGKNGGTSIL